jgi:hypothetical protein
MWGWRLSMIVLASTTLECNLILGHRQPIVDDASASDAAPEAIQLASPQDVFGSQLVLWLDADEPSTIAFDDAATGVASWKDRSSWHNDASVQLSNAPSASPTSSIKLAPQIAHGHAAMSFTGIWDATGVFNVADASSLEFGTNDFAITMVVSYVNTPAYDEYSSRAQLWQKREPASPYWGSVMMGNAYSAPLPDGGLAGADSVVFAGIENFIQGPSAGTWSATDKWNDGKLHAFTMRKDNATSRVYVRTDGVETASVTTISTGIDLSANGQPLQIGGDTVDGSCCWSVLHGAIAEVIAVNGSSMTPTQMSALGAYLQGKYGLTL